MCSNLVNNLECYMDDLVDSFESFVKKSLIILMVAVGAIISMFIYALRVITERQLNTLSSTQERRNSEPPIAENPGSNSRLKSKTDQCLEDKCLADKCLQKDISKNSYVLQFSKSIANTTPLPCVTSFDERVLRDIGFTNCSRSESDSSSKESLTNCPSTPRATNSSLPTNEQKQDASSTRPLTKYNIAVRNSCCSVCCDDDNQR